MNSKGNSIAARRLAEDGTQSFADADVRTPNPVPLLREARRSFVRVTPRCNAVETSGGTR